jgi:hypothetical protein
MITIIKNGSRVVDPNITLLDSDTMRYGYTSYFFKELGVEVEEYLEPEKNEDSWYIEGSLHGLPVCATFNTFENMKLSVFKRSVSYNESMEETFNSFMYEYRETWDEHNNQRKHEESFM